jgi:hypothetical protein
MKVNGRLTAPPFQAELVTNFVYETLPMGVRPVAGGSTLENSPFKTGLRLRAKRTGMLVRAAAWTQWKSGPATATHSLSFDGGTAPGR